MKKIKLICSIFLIGVIFLVSSCGSNKKFNSWNSCDSLTALTTYVDDATNKNSKNYIPVEDRIATFDMDGTLVGELYPCYFEYLLFCHRVLDDTTYTGATKEMIDTANLIRKNKYTWNMKESSITLDHAYGQAKAFAGMKEDEFIKYVKNFANTNAEGFNNLKYIDAAYKPMIEVVNYLQKNEFTTYIVSGSDRFICRALASEVFNIPYNQIIGMDTTIVGTNQADNDGLDYQLTQGEEVVKGDTLLIKNLKMNKVVAITKEIGKQPVLAFGNSSGDTSMLNYAINNTKYKGQGYMLIADDIDRDYANLEKAEELRQQWEKNNFHVISMKNDFKTIYGENVTLKK